MAGGLGIPFKRGVVPCGDGLTSCVAGHSLSFHIGFQQPVHTLAVVGVLILCEERKNGIVAFVGLLNNRGIVGLVGFEVYYQPVSKPLWLRVAEEDEAIEGVTQVCGELGLAVVVAVDDDSSTVIGLIIAATTRHEFYVCRVAKCLSQYVKCLCITLIE